MNITQDTVITEASETVINEASENVVFLGYGYYGAGEESVTLSDTLSKLSAWGRILSDDVTLSETCSKILNRLYSDIVTLTDVVNKGGGRELSDDITVADSVTKDYMHNAIENITISDLRLLALRRLLADAVTLSDVVNKGSTKKPILENIVLSDNVQEWLNKHSKPTTWTAAAGPGNPWVIVSTSTSIWV